MGELPELVRTLQEIFDQLWREIEPKVDERETDRQRSRLARQIIQAHKTGLKPEEIKAAILKEHTPPERRT
jgi:hypothetical protein